MWLIESMGLDQFRAAVETKMGQALLPAAPEDAITDENKNDHLGVHRQKQPGMNYVGLHVPVGHIYADDMFEFARLAEVYGNGEIRLTVEQNVIIAGSPCREVLDRSRTYLESARLLHWLALLQLCPD